MLPITYHDGHSKMQVMKAFAFLRHTMLAPHPSVRALTGVLEFR